MDDNTPLLGLKNIGPTIAERLETVGVKTVGDLKLIGVPTAFKRVKSAYSEITIPVCYYLYSLQGALEDVHWTQLSQETKNCLLKEANMK